MNAEVASLLTHKLRRLADAPPEQAAALIREYLEAERSLKSERKDQIGMPLTLLHHGRQRLNVI